MDLDRFDYVIPRELIAQRPLEPRDASRLLVVKGEEILHDKFENIVNYLAPRDVLVLNDSRVSPARLIGKKATGGKVEVLLVSRREGNVWDCLTKCKISAGESIDFGGVRGSVISRNDGRCSITLGCDDIDSFLRTSGQIPLPPYVKEPLVDPQRYQTVYASREDSIAAPTAGLHLTRRLLRTIKDTGVSLAFITLHVGPATFLPLRSRILEEGRTEAERLLIGENAAKKVNDSIKRGGRIFAVGTTTMKALETAWGGNMLNPFDGFTDILILPGYRFKSPVHALLTNLHLPKSPNLLLVSAFAGEERTFAVYREAIAHRYRFYTFGDAMLVFR